MRSYHLLACAALCVAIAACSATRLNPNKSTGVALTVQVPVQVALSVATLDVTIVGDGNVPVMMSINVAGLFDASGRYVIEYEATSKRSGDLTVTYVLRDSSGATIGSGESVVTLVTGAITQVTSNATLVTLSTGTVD